MTEQECSQGTLDRVHQIITETRRIKDITELLDRSIPAEERLFQENLKTLRGYVAELKGMEDRPQLRVVR